MNHPSNKWMNRLRKKVIVVILLAITTVGAFATLGDGKLKSNRSKSSLLSDRIHGTPGSFSLKSGYMFRGNQVINSRSEKFVSLNTVVSYQKGNTTYILPLKKKVMLDKVVFNPNASTRRY
jgi:hypothetical protein